MAKEKITNHGPLHDFINYNALIEAQANEETFLDGPKEYNFNDFKKFNSKPKVKKKTLSYKEKDSTRKKW